MYMHYYLCNQQDMKILISHNVSYIDIRWHRFILVSEMRNWTILGESQYWTSIVLIQTAAIGNNKYQSKVCMDLLTLCWGYDLFSLILMTIELAIFFIEGRWTRSKHKYVAHKSDVISIYLQCRKLFWRVSKNKKQKLHEVCWNFELVVFVTMLQYPATGGVLECEQWTVLLD